MSETEQHDGGAAGRYAYTVDKLRERLEEFMRREPRAMEIAHPFDLFDLGFELGELEPSNGQAAWAFARAKDAERARRLGAGEGSE